RCYAPCLSPSRTPSDTTLTPSDLWTCLQIVAYVLVSVSFPVPDGDRVVFQVPASSPLECPFFYISA
ncbi:hypothetical protein BD309DRAFT_878059, partial [Dichomitus squalens]